tara:strand:- start:16622 stop:17014 length:393 start_codon:yes stop_codon:yes gene_type:complete
MRKKTRKNIVKRLDTLFSLYIRLRESDNEMVKCFTCGKVSHYKKNMQCGHFQSRSAYSTRWDITNCQVQCYGCNVMQQGRQYQFGLNLEKKYGKGTAEKLLIKSKQTVKYSNEDLQELIQYYNNLVNQLL